jgi:hypothetical protein
MHSALLFFSGLIAGIGIIGVWHGLRFLADVKAANHATENALRALHGSDKDEEAQRAVSDCKARLRWQKNLNPEWIEPLVEAVPRLVREIAGIYYPAEPKPLLSPGLSHFTRAVHLAAMDIADFLQTRTVGRLVDVSANTAIDAWNRGKQMMQSDTFKSASKWYKRVLPLLQVARYKSPLMWATVAVSNVAVRALQPALIDIIARRTIELYSGRLAAGLVVDQYADEVATGPARQAPIS